MLMRSVPMQKVKTIKQEVAKKEEEIRAVQARLNEASKSLAAKMADINQLRKASNDLRQRIEANAQVLQVSSFCAARASKCQRKCLCCKV